MFISREPFQRKKVFVNVETVSKFGRDIIESVYHFGRRHNWDVIFESRTLSERLPQWFLDWEGDGIITRSGSLAVLRSLSQKNIPTVELVGRSVRNGAEVTVDTEKMSEMVFRHFLERGFKNYAIFAFTDTWWVRNAKKVYARVLARAGFQCITYDAPEENEVYIPKWTEKRRQEIVAWLHALPAPCSLFVLTDQQAVQILHICHLEKIKVPHEIAVVSVENDPWLCSMVNPPLSSMDQNGKRIGHLAADLLARRMEGKSLEHQHITIPPLFIETRQSSDCVAVDNPELIRVAAYIREMSSSGVTVQDVVRQSRYSHSKLAKLFREQIGHTMEQEIRRIKVERAKHLLFQTTDTIQSIAEMTGFGTFEYFCRIFKEETGMTPGEFRSMS